MPPLSYRIPVPNELIEDIRIYLSDKPEFNRLIAGTEFSNDQMKLAVRLWLNKFNTTPPDTVQKYTNLAEEDFPAWDILFEGVLIKLLIMGGIVNTRNFLNFNDAGVSFTVSDKGNAYQGWISQLISKHEDDVKSLRTSINAEEAYSIISSPEDFGLYVDDI